MKIIKLFLVIGSFSLLTTNSYAQNFGLGVILGSPTGLSMNYKLENDKSIDGALAFDLNSSTDFHVHSTYLLRSPKSIAIGDAMFGWYWGLGAKLRILDHDYHFRHGTRHAGDNFWFGPRGALGMNYEFEKNDIELFLEASLTMHLIQHTHADLDAGIGVRFYF